MCNNYSTHTNMINNKMLLTLINPSVYSDIIPQAVNWYDNFHKCIAVIAHMIISSVASLIT